MQTNQSPETKNQNIDRNRFAKDPIKAGTSQEVGEDETALTEGGVALSPEASEREDLPEDEQTTLNTSGVQEGEPADEAADIRGDRKRESA